MKTSINPLSLSGIEFVEFASPDSTYMHNVFKDLGFSKLHKHNVKDIYHYQQNKINFLLNEEKHGFAHSFAVKHGPSIPSLGLRFRNSDFAFNEAIRRGASPVNKDDQDLHYPAIYGIGESIIYFIEESIENNSIYEKDFNKLDKPEHVKEIGFLIIDHLTNNVHKGTMQKWVDFYKDIFGFTEAHFFDIKGEMSGLTSYALRSPDGSFCIPINEGKEDASQIEEYLRDYAGPGVQHIALLTKDILRSLDNIELSNIDTLDINNSYYDSTFKRFPPKSKEIKDRIIHHQVLIDGNDDGNLMQIFTKNIFGPIFFEIIQRNGCLGFGEGNFQALFESIERDQIKRETIEA